MIRGGKNRLLILTFSSIEGEKESTEGGWNGGAEVEAGCFRVLLRLA